MKFSIRIAVVTSACYLSLAPVSALAQIEWLNPEGRPGLQFEFTAGSFENYESYWYTDSYPFPTASMFMTLRSRFSNSASVVFEFSSFATKHEYYDSYYTYSHFKKSRLGIANPYLGFELGKEGSSPLWNFGIRFPIISEDNSYWAIPSQYISSHRFLAYVNKVLTISSNWGYRYVPNSGFGLRATLGGQLAIPDRGNKEFFGDLATNFWYRTQNVRFMIGLSSLCLLTESDIDFTDRLLTSVSFSADITMGQVEPGIHVQLPIGDNLSESINNMYGVHIAYHFPTGDRP